MTHIDAPAHRKPLPLVEVPDLWPMVRPLIETLPSKAGEVATTDGPVKLTLYSDSEHLRAFFSCNFGTPVNTASSTDNAIIIAIASDSDPSVPGLKPGMRYVDPERRLVVSLGNEYYGNVKVSVRGLCSAAIARRGKGGFLHGASMSLRGSGMVVSGVSGAGKTTITRALMTLCPGDIQIINDDWGWADQDSRLILFTGEPHLHMKYRSVHAIAPQLALSTELYPSENYTGDINDPHARLLIPRSEVFNGAAAAVCPFDALVVVTRDESESVYVRDLSPDDIDLLEAAEYSAFYDRHERFMDGSLLLLNEEDLRRERARFSRLLERIPAVHVNNVGSPTAVAEQLLARLGI